MKNRRGIRLIVVALCGAVRMLPGAAGAIAVMPVEKTLRLEQVLQAVMRKVDNQDTRVSLARGQLQVLESMNRAQIQFRPQLGLFSFSNPVLLAASLGTGFSFTRGKSVSPFLMEGARLDVLSARMTLERTRLHAQVESVHQYFDLLTREYVAQRRCTAAQSPTLQPAKLQSLVEAGSLTALDMLRVRERQLDNELACEEAEINTKASQWALATLLETDPGRPAALAAYDSTTVSALDGPLPAVDSLLEMALDSRNEVKEMLAELDRLNQEPPAQHRLFPTSLTLDYRHVGNSYGMPTNGWPLFGGHTVQTQLPWTIALKETGQRSAERQVALSRLKSAQMEAASLAGELRSTLQQALLEASRAQKKLEILRTKVDLAARKRAMLALRAHAGLEPDLILGASDWEAVEGEIGIRRAESELRSSLFTMAAVCGHEISSSDHLQRFLQQANQVSEKSK